MSDILQSILFDQKCREAVSDGVDKMIEEQTIIAKDTDDLVWLKKLDQLERKQQDRYGMSTAQVYNMLPKVKENHEQAQKDLLAIVKEPIVIKMEEAGIDKDTIRAFVEGQMTPIEALIVVNTKIDLEAFCNLSVTYDRDTYNLYKEYIFNF